jgi:uncharacterized membrane protein
MGTLFDWSGRENPDMGAYFGYTAIIWLIALGVTGKHTFVMSLFEARDSILEKCMMSLLLSLVWAFSVIFLPWFIWHHIQKYRDESRFRREQQKEKEDKRNNTETEFDTCWSDDL